MENSWKCIISPSNVTTEAATFALTDTKLYVPEATLSTEENAKLLQVKSGFKRTINWKNLEQNQYLHYLIDPSFQGVNKLFVLSFEDNAKRIS